MSAPTIVIGSGASAVHFAKSLLDRGIPVTILDVGKEAPAHVEPEADFQSLKDLAGDGYFLGARFEGAVLPGDQAEYYALPPGKSYVFESPKTHRLELDGFAPLSSFARGGLAEAWTAGAYPYTPEELSSFPVAFEEMQRAYATVASRIGVAGAKDDLERFMPLHDGLLAPLDLDAHSAELLSRYERRRSELTARQGFYLGRSRIAVLRDDALGRKGCTYLSRCLFGCPNGSLYTPAMTLEECRRHPLCTYHPGWYVSHFTLDPAGRATSVVALPVNGGGATRFEVGRLVLGAGALGTARLVLESLRHAGRPVPRLLGLMDNRQVLVPFLNLARIGRQPERRSYQYHQIAVGLDGGSAEEHVHGQITTLKSALVHPVVQGLPLNLRAGLGVFRRTRAGLGLLNANFSDRRRAGCWVELVPGSEGPEGVSTLRVHYEAPQGEPARIARALRRIRKGLGTLGCRIPPGMVHVRPMGASIHYAGTLPMTTGNEPLTTRRDGRVNGFENLWVVDGSVFPSLSAKQLTFTMMANAARVGEAFAE